MKSKLGKGSVFHFTIPLQLCASGSETHEQKDPDLHGLHVLIVDDNKTNRRILHEILENWDMRPTAVETGAEALAIMETARSTGDPYALVLLDAQIPVMDGFQIAESIKSSPALNETPIIILTSGGQHGDVARCHEMGVSSYLLKPIRQSDLFDAIVSTLGAGKAGEAGPSEGTMQETATRLLRVLLAEDNAVNQTLATRILERRGHTVVTASDGSVALSLFQTQVFDIVLMDVQMPVMDGFAATKAIREMEASTGGHIPIVAMTAHTMKRDRERCLEAGMDAYVSKPVRADVLLETMYGLVTDVESPQPEDDENASDAEAALKRVEGDAELFREMIEAYLETYPGLLEQIKASVDADDRKALRQGAHTMKGMVANFCAERAVSAARSLEQCSLNGSRDDVMSALKAVETEVIRLHKSLLMFTKEKAA